MKSVVFSKFEVEGLHNWTDCPIEEVKYLKNSHRHLFGIIAYKEITNLNREIEFIEFQHEIKSYLNAKYYDNKYKCLNFKSMSCEMIAKELVINFDLLQCEVNEDSRDGAIIYR